MQVVPKPESIDPVDPVSMAKAVPFPSSTDLLTLAGPTLLFDKLVPYAVQQANTEYAERRSKLVEDFEGQAKDASSLGIK
jgi:hypothetical protein